MLYKLTKTSKKFDAIDPMPFTGLPKEKELENLLAENLFDVLFENRQLMPIRQERAWQPEADIYALNEEGELWIFELKRAQADGGAVHQALRYCEKASQYKYDDLDHMYREYKKDQTLDLQQEHKDVFNLEHELERSAFNREQHLVVVGSAGDNELVRNVDYWKTKGILIDFIPYRVYEIKSENYFEFFSLPYDQHSNPAEIKGVIFDTNYSWDKDSIWYMCENKRVAAFGEIKGIMHSFNKGDIAFLYHKGFGVVAAGEVKSDVKEDKKKDALYRDLKWLTPLPKQNEEKIKSISASEIKSLMGFNFWWAKTMKYPYLDKPQSDRLLEKLKSVL